MKRSRRIGFFPSFTLPISNCVIKQPRLRLITPSYSLNGINSAETDLFVAYIEQTLSVLLHRELLRALAERKQQPMIKKNIITLAQNLPLLHINYPQFAPCTVKATALCPSEFTGGVGRYLSDTFSHWLVPGKILNISCIQSLNFSFIAYPLKKFFLHQIFLDVHSEEDRITIKNNWESLKNEIHLNILSVKHARHVIAIKKLSSEQKNAIIQENIASIIDRPLKDINHNAFDHMHHFLLQVTAEEKLSHTKEQFSPAFEQRPKAFQRDIFTELKYFVLLFGEKFTALHSFRYISRLISYQHLFRKSLQRIILSAPGERHLSVKLLKAQLNYPLKNGSKTVLGVFGAMNVLRENELFEERHLWQAIRHCLHNVRKVENSFILDRRSHDPIRIFYIEIEKKDELFFKAEEIKELQKHLPSEIKESIESVIHPVFMPRNEEEIMRNIVLLSQQIHYVSDLPQVIISFDTQAEQELVFRVILLRILKDKTSPLMDFFSASTELKIFDLEIKNVGLLRKKHIKEANVFKVSLNKKKFLRKDFSIDLFKARQALSSELNTLLYGIRDFNGGILSKQQEAFMELRTLLKDTITYKDFLLENFFYSLTPPLHQSLIRPLILKELFILTLEAFEANYAKKSVFFKAHTINDDLLIVIASCCSQLKNALFSNVNTLQIPSSDLSFVHVLSYDINCFGYIYRNRCIAQRQCFYSTITQCLKNVVDQIKN